MNLAYFTDLRRRGLDFPLFVSSPFWGGECPILETRPVLVTVLRWKTLNFDDETYSRRQFEGKNGQFWRRNPFSSPFWGRKRSILATRPNLVTNLRRRKLIFDDETESRRQFEGKNDQFWRRNAFSSPIWGKKRPILTTKRILVTILRWKKHYFGDEPLSPHRFWSGNFIFWRRGLFSSPFLGKKRSILTTKRILVANLGRGMLFFDDEAESRHQFEEKKANFWRRNRISSSFWGRKGPILTTKRILVANLRREMLFFDDEAESRHQFEVKNAQFWRRNPISSPIWGEKCCFWRRNPFSSPFWGEKSTILATSLFLVTVFGRETSFFGDEACSRHRFEVKNTQFWRRTPFSSPFWGEKHSILTTNPNLVTILGRKTLNFGDEAQSRC